MVISFSACAQNSSYGELQSAYLFNFAKYIQWPREADSFVIGIFGETEISSDLENTLKGKKVRGLEIQMKEISSLDNLPECNIIYLPASNSKNLAALKNATAGKHILIVSENDLIKKGASISFVIEDDRLRFKLNVKSLSDAELTATEGLLKLALQ
jgi:hypothetical protein